MKQKTKKLLEKAKMLQQPKKGGRALQKDRSIAQQALEYLLTYGWGMVLAAVIIGVFVLLFSPGTACTQHHSFSQNFLIDSFEITGSDSTLLPNKFVLVLRPKLPATIESYNISFNDSACSGNVVQQKFPVGRFEKFVITGDITSECSKTIGQCYQFSDSIGYTDHFGLQRNEQGRIGGAFSEISQSYETTAWERSAFSPNILKNENNQKIGSFNGKCPAEVPKPEDGINFIPAAAYETWSLPTGCDTGCSQGGCTNGGFGNTHCKKNARYLAHGWYHAKLRMSPLFANRRLFLVGNASFNPPGGGERVTNGICINDNFYFYVNGQLLSMGGTTGQQNKEVIRRCNGCTESDDWCIWPVELSAAEQFKFGEWNDIYVLVEDYCNGGGLKAFNFYMA